jgi:protein TonB
VTPVVQATPQPVRSEPEVIARTAQPIETPPAPAVEQPSAAAPAAQTQPPETVSQPTGVQTVPVRSMPAPQRDYGWLAETLRDRIEELKRYPPMARMNNWQGKVVLKFVVTEDGTVESLEVMQSSGHAVLDEAAMETIRRASPLPLKHELGKPRVTFQFPISYTLR